ncbi:mitochondrial import receptor subunit tom-20 [Gaeumannomyces tritici R3-111a-1]|uniref:Mitochondrial import receptor subunit tom-20 n=1 Tax=Gaeumannomyces tritici (strain R3-111a-1) TaxID=644352 RepID=J3NR61_GAET3|nr:mitochondrial import receptor subunit tom-20 [Gaeumannomyces tritici R3-111a-1]EJT78667.1 mitochondrial import receptor subunit tom-20 [Gaeumannomyces tritici R3-111a-1]
MADTRMIVTASATAVVTGLLAYAVFFDYRRRHSPEFRRQLRRNERRQARSEKEDAEAAEAGRLHLISQIIDEAKATGYPDNVEEKEQYFQEQITIGETLSTNATADPVQVALHFYNALKVYPSPGDLIHIYNNIVPKPILDVLAEMIAYDTTLLVGSTSGAKAQTAGASIFEAGEGSMPPVVGLD